MGLTEKDSLWKTHLSTEEQICLDYQGGKMRQHSSVDIFYFVMFQDIIKCKIMKQLESSYQKGQPNKLTAITSVLD